MSRTSRKSSGEVESGATADADTVKTIAATWPAVHLTLTEAFSTSLVASLTLASAQHLGGAGETVLDEKSAITSTGRGCVPCL